MHPQQGFNDRDRGEKPTEPRDGGMYQAWNTPRHSHLRDLPTVVGAAIVIDKLEAM